MSRVATEDFEAERVTMLEVRRGGVDIVVWRGLLVRDRDRVLPAESVSLSSGRGTSSLEDDRAEATLTVLPRRIICCDGRLSAAAATGPAAGAAGTDNDAERTRMPRGALRDRERRERMLWTEASSPISASRGVPSSLKPLLVFINSVDISPRGVLKHTFPQLALGAAHRTFEQSSGVRRFPKELELQMVGQWPPGGGSW